MNDTLIFVGLLVAVLLVYMTWKLWGKSWKEYFGTKAGKGILKGIVLAPTIILVIAFVFWLGMFLLIPTAKADSWFNDASVFAGIDHTKKQSPQCDVNTIDNNGTSNMGAKVNLWQSDSKNVRVNSKYTHHSCVLGTDNKAYDAVGVELEWKVWTR